MTPADKYDTEDPLFDVEHNVLVNKLKITDPDKLEQVESDALISAYETSALSYSDDHSFSVKDIQSLHRLFLGDVFEWAGEYRLIDIFSVDIRWCHAQYIPKEMHRIDQWLSENTPFQPDWTREKIAKKIAEIHGELVVIHPFRDGNGRTTRLLCDLLLMQSHRPTMYSEFFYKNREPYFEAIQQVWREALYEKLTTLILAWMDSGPS